MKRHIYSWEKLNTPHLLKVKICDLQLSVEHAAIQSPLGQLYLELAKKGLRFKPHVWVSTSWFSPYGVPGFAVPFYLLHPRLAELEDKYIGEVEGGTSTWLMQLLRHETGHAIDNAFLLRKSKERQKLFGLSGTPYPLRYRPMPQSRRFVRHLENNYAQAHPDEDWAETFAVWLDPQSNWQERYKGWAALEKLELADRLLQRIVGVRQPVFNLETLEEVGNCEQTLADYFREKQRKFAPTAKQRQNIIAESNRRWIIM